MKLTMAEMQLDDGNRLIYAGEPHADPPLMPDTPVLLIGVTDFEEAQEIVATLDRSRARKRAQPKDTQPPAPAAETVTPSGKAAARGQEGLPPAKCIAPSCTFDADAPADTCRDHAGATEEEKAAWRKAREDAQKPTPPAVGKRRAKAIREQLEGGTAPAAEPGKVA